MELTQGDKVRVGEWGGGKVVWGEGGIQRDCVVLGGVQGQGQSGV